MNKCTCTYVVVLYVLEFHWLRKNIVLFSKAAISLQHFELLEVSIGYSLLLTNYHHKRQIFQLYR